MAGISKRKLDEASPAVFARNHAIHLNEAVGLNRPVTFRSNKPWSSAERARAHRTRIPIYFATVRGEGTVEFIADLIDTDLGPTKRRKKTRGLLAQCTPSTHAEGLPPDVSTLYLVDNCRRVREPFPFTDLVKLSDDLPLAANFKYSYAMVHRRGTGPLVAESLPGEVDDPELFPEGATTQVSVVAYERNRKARAACLRRHGYDCAACGMNFEERYGEIGAGFIHVHHRVPLSKVDGSYRINPSRDLVPLCPNCHAMVHRPKSMLSVQELSRSIRR